uniref:DNA damage regulated autophagy modulator 1 n=1 Tax=Equus caballus TaxID=9796 RepID=F6T7V5_HORSE
PLSARPPPRSALRPPPRSALRAPCLRPGLPCRRGASSPAARGRARRDRRLAGQHVRGPRLRRPGAAPRPGPAERSASRRRRDAVLPEGNGLRPLPPGDLVVRRLHHLLRGRGALRARQPLPPLHQELAVPVVHDGGALLAFVCGVVYTLLQSIISYKSCPQWNSLSTCHVRLAISAISCAAVIPMIACASLISITKLEWNPKEKDYVYHVVSAICEWTVAFGFIFYFLTFVQDFQSVTLRISTELNGAI